MTLMNKAGLAASCAVLAAVTASAQSSSAPRLNDTPLTLTGCVVQGERPDSYLIRNTTIGGAGMALAPAGAFYRLDTTKGLAAHVNHQVEISGRADLADIDKGTVTTTTNAAGEQRTTGLNSERRTTTAKDATVLAGTAGTETSVKTRVDTYKFTVGTIRMISSTCA